MRFWIEEDPRRLTGATPKDSVGVESDAILADLPAVRCRRCGRVLRSDRALHRGYGWRCARRGGGRDE